MTVRVFAVVEDDPDARMVVRTLLSEDGRFSLTMEAASAEEALRIVRALGIARAEPPDLIVLDHNLDGPLTGLEAASLLKLEAPQAKIILFTGAEEIRDRAIEQDDVDAFVGKSRPDDLLPAARRVLGI
ncbi:MAG: response regulator [Actinomycetota bacterium]|nr:response regulator [Actinomycetota bacterium]